MYFVVNKMSYVYVSGPGPLLVVACTDSYYAYKMIKCIQRCSKYKTSSKLCSFNMTVTDCLIFGVD